MEVTSHALSQNRVDGIRYDVAIFTNITPEHLDYHGTMEAYIQEKAKLFKRLKPNGIAILNQDDPMSSFMKCSNRVVTYGIENFSDYRAVDIKMDPSGTEFKIEFHGRSEQIKVPLIGRFNVYNVLAAVACSIEKGISWEEIKRLVSTFKSVPGRLERVSCKKEAFVFVDFSHKTDALKNVLMTLREIGKGRIITIFGCGGNRDREKRPKMAKVAEEYSDFVIVTSDNPRNEDPEDIIREIQSGFNTKNYLIEIDRKLAIQKGLQLLEKGDILLIAGKGHENNQIFADKSIFFDDVKVAKELANIVG
jgi:UDP-N-acetylmuramoyl-L-alanyl-D-glutamate--2,6-diaminopimelate ligase